MSPAGPATGEAPRAATFWVTRASPGAEVTAERLRRLGFEPLVRPLLVVEPLPGGEIDLTGVGALAFTSQNGVEAFARRSKDRRLPVFAVGAATANAARATGFAEVASAEGDVEALAVAIMDLAAPLAGDILHAAPEEASGDLCGALAARGVPARRVVVYRTVADPPDEAFWNRVAPISGVLLHSAKAARVLDACLAAGAKPRPTAFCLSRAVASVLGASRFRAIHIADRPDDAALLDLVIRERRAG